MNAPHSADPAPVSARNALPIKYQPPPAGRLNNWWRKSVSQFFGSPKLVQERLSFAGCPADILDVDGTRWHTTIHLVAGLSDQLRSGFTNRLMDELARLNGCIDVGCLQQLCKRIGKGREASAQWLSLEFHYPTDHAEDAGIGPLAHYRVEKKKAHVQQHLQARFPVQCQYANNGGCSHDQHLNVSVILRATRPVALKTLHAAIEQQAQCTLSGLLKADDQRDIPLEPPGRMKYLEDIAEDIFSTVRRQRSVQRVLVCCESPESQHNYQGSSQVQDFNWSPIVSMLSI